MRDRDHESSADSIKSAHRVRICPLCGSRETSQWKRHWKRNHPLELRYEEGQPKPSITAMTPKLGEAPSFMIPNTLL